MDAVLDSSTLISLAWAGELRLLHVLPLELSVPDVVRTETVTEGISRGHPDAAAIEEAIAELPTVVTAPGSTSPDDAVLEAARAAGALASNDAALGRRASNIAITWLRTADLVILAARTGRLSPQRGSAALRALHGAGRITADLLTAYEQELR